MKKRFLNLLAPFLPLLLPAAEPVFYFPLDGSGDVIGADGKKNGAAIVEGRAGYLSGVIGKALDVRRHAYDQVTVMTAKNLPAQNLTGGTVAFWFKPHWKENDPEQNFIISGRDSQWKFRFYMINFKDGATELSVCAPKQVQIIRKKLFEQGKWHHVAFTWNQANGEVRLFINGKEVAKRSIPNAFEKMETPRPLNLFLGNESTDRFKAQVGNGLYDEVKIFNIPLTPAEIFVLASGGAKENFKELSLDSAVRSERVFETVFRNSESRYAGPKKLLVLHGTDSKRKISFTAMGASGRLSMIAENSGETKTLETASSFPLTEPHRITLLQNGKELIFKLDDGVQGKVVFSVPFGKIVKAEGAEGVSLSAPSSVPSAKQRKRLSDLSVRKAELPLWDLADAARAENGIRKGVCLNGHWRVIPVDDYSYAPPEGEWGYMRVPGSFRSPLFQIYRDNNGKLESANGKWNGKSIAKKQAGWYQRVFEVPVDLKDGGRIYLNFANLNGDAGRVYLNGKLIHEFRQDFKSFMTTPNSKRLDVTEVVNRNGRNVVTVFIDRRIVSMWKGEPSIGDHSELAIGDVWLENAPSAVSLKNAVASPSFRRKNIRLRARIQNLSGEKGKARVRFDFVRNGKTEKSFTKEIELDGRPEQLIIFTENWKNPVLWNADTPELYRMRVALERNGKALDALPEQNFGFREAWIEKGAFRLNGNKLRMRMWSSPGMQRVRFYYGTAKGAEQYVAHIREMNYDAVRYDLFGKESQIGTPEYLNESDRQGLYNIFPMPPYEDEEKAFYNAEIERFFEHYGNHPAILIWYTEFNTCGYPWNQDPAKLTDTAYAPVRHTVARKRAQYAEDTMRSLDSGRECIRHAGGNVGKAFTSMNYQSFGTPLQEQEDWPAQWSASERKQPLLVMESGFPYPAQFWHFRSGGASGDEMIPEHAARYFGDSVFAREDRPVPNASCWLDSPYAPRNRNRNALNALMYSHVVKAWRAYDMSALGDFPGERDLARTARTFDHHNTVYEIDDNVKTPGYKPDVRIGTSETQRHLLTDYSIPEGLYDVIRDAFNPLLVFLGGMAEDFTNKDHAFFSGEKVRKSAVVVNDHASERKLVFRWELVMNGVAVQQGTFDAAAPAGEILKLPIELTAPDVLERTDAELRLLVLKDGVLYKKDSFALQFFPRHAKRNFRKSAAGLYDPEGKTEAVLKAAGFPFRKVKSLKDVKDCRLLIIGQNALKDANPEFLKQMENSGLLEGGLKILIFEQQPCNLGNFVFESPSYRNAFIRRPESLYLRGLKDADFSNWRGASDTVPAFVVSDENSPHYPRSKWKCGNGGIVSGNVIRKPSYGNFTAVVDCGFNLMFASLMELRKEHGLVLFCQLDVTSRYGKDPAATLLVDNMLEEMNKPFVPVGPQRVVYLGDEKNESILKRMGMQYSKGSADNLWYLNNAQVVLLGANPVPASQYEKLKKFLENRTVVALPGAPLAVLPGNLKAGGKQVFRAALPKNDPLFAGITEADLYFREAQNLPVLTSMPDWMVATEPALFAKLDRVSTATVVLNLAPDMVKGFWGLEKVMRVWSAIFNNMNLGLGKDLKLFTASKSRHNTLKFRFGKAELENTALKLDPENKGTPADTDGFVPVKLGIPWEDQGFTQKNPHYSPVNPPKRMVPRPYDGYAWYRCTVKIPASWKSHAMRLVGGPVDDCDWTYFNGRLIGKTTLETNPDSYAALRNYEIPADAVKFGEENTLMIRVFDRWGSGGVVGPLQVVAEDADSADAWSPYIDGLDFYDVDAFHNW